jgi:hypothetical protein
MTSVVELAGPSVAMIFVRRRRRSRCEAIGVRVIDIPDVPA